MPECPICRREYDDRFSVFVPPHPEGFDSIECAQRAAAIWAASEAAPVILPTIEVVPPAAPVVADRPASAAPRRGLAALAALALIPGQAALAAGVGLATAGTAASIYLAAKPVLQPSHPASVATGAAPAPPPTAPSSGSPAPAPAAPPSGSSGGQSTGATSVDRPARKPAPSSHVSTRPARQVHTVHVARAQAVSPAHHPSFSSPRAANFVTRSVTPHPSPPVAVSRPHPASQPKSQPTPKPDRAPTKPRPKPHSPRPPAPHEPTPTTTPTTTTPQEPQPVSTGRVLASIDSPTPKKKKTKKSQPVQAPTPAPSPAPTPAQSNPGTSSSGGCDDTRPGNGYGDGNHDHTGPPGQDHHDGDSSQHGDDHGAGNGHGDDHGNGNGHGDDHGNGNGHGNGH